jgi:hypothetical protein
LPFAFCLLPFAFCLLPFAFCLDGMNVLTFSHKSAYVGDPLGRNLSFSTG